MKFLGFFKAIWKFITGDKAKAVFQKIDAMVEEALPIVQEIVSLTPTRSDDEILALFEKYGLTAATNVNTWLALPVAQRGAALLYAAEQELAKLFPNAPLNQLSSAINLAVSLIKVNPAATSNP